MAYVHPRRSTDDALARVVRQGRRVVAIAAYAAAVAVALVILSPLLPSRGSEAAADIPVGPQPVLYTIRPGDTLSGIASSNGISLARLFALNPKLAPLSDTNGESVVVGLR
jgi:LysM repeat protein